MTYKDRNVYFLPCLPILNENKIQNDDCDLPKLVERTKRAQTSLKNADTCINSTLSHKAVWRLTSLDC